MDNVLTNIHKSKFLLNSIDNNNDNYNNNNNNNNNNIKKYTNFNKLNKKKFNLNKQPQSVLYTKIEIPVFYSNLILIEDMKVENSNYYVSSNGFLSSKLHIKSLKHSKNFDINECVFRIFPKTYNINKNKVLEAIKQNNYKILVDEKVNFKFESEILNNLDILNSKLGEPIKYGDTIMLMHEISHKFVKFNYETKNLTLSDHDNDYTLFQVEQHTETIINDDQCLKSGQCIKFKISSFVCTNKNLYFSMQVPYQENNLCYNSFNKLNETEVKLESNNQYNLNLNKLDNKNNNYLFKNNLTIKEESEIVCNYSNFKGNSSNYNNNDSNRNNLINIKKKNKIDYNYYIKDIENYITKKSHSYTKSNFNTENNIILNCNNTLVVKQKLKSTDKIKNKNNKYVLDNSYYKEETIKLYSNLLNTLNNKLTNSINNKYNNIKSEKENLSYMIIDKNKKLLNNNIGYNSTKNNSKIKSNLKQINDVKRNSSIKFIINDYEKEEYNSYDEYYDNNANIYDKINKKYIRNPELIIEEESSMKWRVGVYSTFTINDSLLLYGDYVSILHCLSNKYLTSYELDKEIIDNNFNKEILKENNYLQNNLELKENVSERQSIVNLSKDSLELSTVIEDNYDFSNLIHKEIKDTYTLFYMQQFKTMYETNEDVNSIWVLENIFPNLKHSSFIRYYESNKLDSYHMAFRIKNFKSNKYLTLKKLTKHEVHKLGLIQNNYKLINYEKSSANCDSKANNNNNIKKLNNNNILNRLSFFKDNNQNINNKFLNSNKNIYYKFQLVDGNTCDTINDKHITSSEYQYSLFGFHPSHNLTNNIVSKRPEKNNFLRIYHLATKSYLKIVSNESFNKNLDNLLNQNFLNNASVDSITSCILTLTNIVEEDDIFKIVPLDKTSIWKFKFINTLKELFCSINNKILNFNISKDNLINNNNNNNFNKINNSISENDINALYFVINNLNKFVLNEFITKFNSNYDFQYVCPSSQNLLFKFNFAKIILKDFIYDFWIIDGDLNNLLDLTIIEEYVVSDKLYNELPYKKKILYNLSLFTDELFKFLTLYCKDNIDNKIELYNYMYIFIFFIKFKRSAVECLIEIFKDNLVILNSLIQDCKTKNNFKSSLDIIYSNFIFKNTVKLDNLENLSYNKNLKNNSNNNNNNNNNINNNFNTTNNEYTKKSSYNKTLIDLIIDYIIISKYDDNEDNYIYNKIKNNNENYLSNNISRNVYLKLLKSLIKVNNSRTNIIENQKYIIKKIFDVVPNKSNPSIKEYQIISSLEKRKHHYHPPCLIELLTNLSQNNNDKLLANYINKTYNKKEIILNISKINNMLNSNYNLITSNNKADLQLVCYFIDNNKEFNYEFKLFIIELKNYLFNQILNNKFGITIDKNTNKINNYLNYFNSIDVNYYSFILNLVERIFNKNYDKICVKYIEDKKSKFKSIDLQDYTTERNLLNSKNIVINNNNNNLDDINNLNIKKQLTANNNYQENYNIKSKLITNLVLSLVHNHYNNISNQLAGSLRQEMNNKHLVLKDRIFKNDYSNYLTISKNWLNVYMVYKSKINKNDIENIHNNSNSFKYDSNTNNNKLNTNDNYKFNSAYTSTKKNTLHTKKAISGRLTTYKSNISSFKNNNLLAYINKEVQNDKIKEKIIKERKNKQNKDNIKELYADNKFHERDILSKDIKIAFNTNNKNKNNIKKILKDKNEYDEISDCNNISLIEENYKSSSCNDLNSKIYNGDNSSISIDNSISTYSDEYNDSFNKEKVLFNDNNFQNIKVCNNSNNLHNIGSNTFNEIYKRNKNKVTFQILKLLNLFINKNKDLFAIRFYNFFKSIKEENLIEYASLLNITSNNLLNTKLTNENNYYLTTTNNDQEKLYIKKTIKNNDVLKDINNKKKIYKLFVSQCIPPIDIPEIKQYINMYLSKEEIKLDKEVLIETDNEINNIHKLFVNEISPSFCLTHNLIIAFNCSESYEIQEDILNLIYNIFSQRKSFVESILSLDDVFVKIQTNFIEELNIHNNIILNNTKTITKENKTAFEFNYSRSNKDNHKSNVEDRFEKLFSNLFVICEKNNSYFDLIQLQHNSSVKFFNVFLKDILIFFKEVFRNIFELIDYPNNTFDDKLIMSYLDEIVIDIDDLILTNNYRLDLINDKDINNDIEYVKDNDSLNNINIDYESIVSPVLIKEASTIIPNTELINKRKTSDNYNLYKNSKNIFKNTNSFQDENTNKTCQINEHIIFLKANKLSIKIYEFLRKYKLYSQLGFISKLNKIKTLEKHMLSLIKDFIEKGKKILLESNKVMLTNNLKDSEETITGKYFACFYMIINLYILSVNQSKVSSDFLVSLLKNNEEVIFHDSILNLMFLILISDSQIQSANYDYFLVLETLKTFNKYSLVNIDNNYTILGKKINNNKANIIVNYAYVSSLKSNITTGKLYLVLLDIITDYVIFEDKIISEGNLDELIVHNTLFFIENINNNFLYTNLFDLFIIIIDRILNVENIVKLITIQILNHSIILKFIPNPHRLFNLFFKCFDYIHEKNKEEITIKHDFNITNDSICDFDNINNDNDIYDYNTINKKQYKIESIDNKNILDNLEKSDTILIKVKRACCIFNYIMKYYVFFKPNSFNKYSNFKTYNLNSNIKYHERKTITIIIILYCIINKERKYFRNMFLANISMYLNEELIANLNKVFKSNIYPLLFLIAHKTLNFGEYLIEAVPIEYNNFHEKFIKIFIRINKNIKELDFIETKCITYYTLNKALLNLYIFEKLNFLLSKSPQMNTLTKTDGLLLVGIVRNFKEDINESLKEYYKASSSKISKFKSLLKSFEHELIEIVNNEAKCFMFFLLSCLEKNNDFRLFEIFKNFIIKSIDFISINSLYKSKTYENKDKLVKIINFLLYTLCLFLKFFEDNSQNININYSSYLFDNYSNIKNNDKNELKDNNNNNKIRYSNNGNFRITNLKEAQQLIIKNGIIEKFLNLICNCEALDSNIIPFIFQIFCLILKGGNDYSQEIFFNNFTKNNEFELSFKYMFNLLSNKIDSIKNNKLSILFQNTEINNSSKNFIYNDILFFDNNILEQTDSLVMKFLQLLCENHNNKLQSLIKYQSSFRKNYDLVTLTNQYLHILLINYESYLFDPIIKCLDLLIEFIQGPCLKNQVCVINSKIMVTLNEIFNLYLKIDNYGNNIDDISDINNNKIKLNNYKTVENIKIKNQNILFSEDIDSFSESSQAALKMNHCQISLITYKSSILILALIEDRTKSDLIYEQMFLNIKKNTLVKLYNKIYFQLKAKIDNSIDAGKTILRLKDLNNFNNVEENSLNSSNLLYYKLKDYLVVETGFNLYFSYLYFEEFEANKKINYNSKNKQSNTYINNKINESYEIENIFNEADRLKARSTNSRISNVLVLISKILNKRNIIYLTFFILYQLFVDILKLFMLLISVLLYVVSFKKYNLYYKLLKKIRIKQLNKQNCYTFYKKYTRSIEVLKNNVNYKVYFILLPYANMYKKYEKKIFLENMNRTNPKTKLIDILKISSSLKYELESVYTIKRQFNKVPILGILFKNIYYWKDISLFLAIIQNIFNVLSFYKVIAPDGTIYNKQAYFGISEDNFLFYIRILATFQCFLAGVILIEFFLKKTPPIVKIINEDFSSNYLHNIQNNTRSNTSYDNNDSEVLTKNNIQHQINKHALSNITDYLNKKKLYLMFVLKFALIKILFIIKFFKMIVFNFEVLYYLLYMTCSILGLYISEFFFAFLLTELVLRIKTLKNILMAIKKPFKELILTFLLWLILIYIFTLIAYTFFVDQFNIISECQSVFKCFATIFYQTNKNDNGIGDYLISIDLSATNRNPVPARFWFDQLYNLIIKILIIQMIAGIIIDNFAQLRNEETEMLNDMKNICSICGQKRNEIEKIYEIYGLDYNYHIKVDHNIFNYVFYIINLHFKDKTEYNGMESYVYNMVYIHKDIAWFPYNKLYIN